MFGEVVTIIVLASEPMYLEFPCWTRSCIQKNLISIALDRLILMRLLVNTSAVELSVFRRVGSRWSLPISRRMWAHLKIRRQLYKQPNTPLPKRPTLAVR